MFGTRKAYGALSLAFGVDSTSLHAPAEADCSHQPDPTRTSCSCPQDILEHFQPASPSEFCRVEQLMVFWFQQRREATRIRNYLL
jgi:hypothetical protein